MLDYIDAPMPFIIGVPRYLWESIKKQKQNIPEDIIIFDLDKNITICNEKLPGLPIKATNSLHSTISSIMKERKEVMELYGNSVKGEGKVLCGVRSRWRGFGCVVV
jgi:hypothetical protein